MARRTGFSPRALGVGVVLLCVVGVSGAWFWGHENAIRQEYDLIVVGASPGGIAASIQAARLGAHVLLLEESDWVGGQMTAGGVGTMDEGSLAARSSGIYKEFVAQATSYYRARNTSFATCYFGNSALCVEPRIGQIVLRNMLREQEPNLELRTGVRVSGVIMNGKLVTGVVADGEEIRSALVVDSGLYGDLLASTGAAFRLGNEESTASPQTNASCIQDITYSPVIRYYPDGVPIALRFAAAPPGYDEKIFSHFAAYVETNGSNVSARRANVPMSFATYAAYRGLPDLASSARLPDGSPTPSGLTTRTLLNLGNDYPAVGTLGTTFISDPQARSDGLAAAELLTLQLLYYIQHDLGESNWSIADDEGYNSSYNAAHHFASLAGLEAFEDQMPQQPYVREGRRVVGVETLTGNELQSAWKDPAHLPRFNDSIAVGYYPMDLHGCRAKLEPGLDSAADLSPSFRPGAFEVPMGVLIPAAIDGFLVTDNNIAVSREANGATREQPIAMEIGQAAGVLAALAIQEHKQPRDVAASEVQAALVAAHAVIHARR